MTNTEIKTATKMLNDRCDRIETCGDDSEGGWCLTAHWATGGQKVFHTPAEVESNHDEFERRAYIWARDNQGFGGDFAAWLALDSDERAEYEAGAAGIPTA